MNTGLNTTGKRLSRYASEQSAADINDVLSEFSKLLPDGGDGTDFGFGFIEDLSRRLYRDIRESTAYRGAVDAAAICKPPEGKPRHYRLLGETPLLRVGLLTLFRFSPIAMHDHLGSHGAQLVVSGQARVRQYEYVTEREKEHRLVMLERLVDRVVRAGDWISHTPDRLNIHEFGVQSQRIVLFSVMLSPPQENSRSWFFSADPFNDNRKRLYTRVGNRTSGQHRSRGEFI